MIEWVGVVVFVAEVVVVDDVIADVIGRRPSTDSDDATRSTATSSVSDRYPGITTSSEPKESADNVTLYNRI